MYLITIRQLQVAQLSDHTLGPVYSIHLTQDCFLVMCPFRNKGGRYKGFQTNKKLARPATSVLSAKVCSHFILKPLCRRYSWEQAGKDETFPRDCAQGADQSRHPGANELGTATQVQPMSKISYCHLAWESEVQQDFPHAKSFSNNESLLRKKSAVPALTSSSCEGGTCATSAVVAASSSGG